MITCHLVRHGETIWHAENRYAGASDIPLTPAGRTQATTLVPWASHANLDLVASSDLSRAVDTAKPLAAAAGLAPATDPRLREVAFGRAEGLTRAEMETQFPDELHSFLTTPASSPLPGGEPGSPASDRGIAALIDLAGGRDQYVMLIVAHTTLIRLMACRLLGIPLDDYRRRFPSLSNVTVTTLQLPHTTDPDHAVGRAALIRFNAEVR